MAVDAERGADRRVAEALLDHAGVNALVERQSRHVWRSPLSVRLGTPTWFCLRRNVALTVSGRRDDPSGRWNTKPSSEKSVCPIDDHCDVHSTQPRCLCALRPCVATVGSWRRFKA